MLEAGDTAPEFSPPNQHGETVAPDFDGATVVYFYPKDFTGGCTIEANEFQDALPEYRDADVTVYGVSKDDRETHADFAGEEGIDFELLADPDGEIADAFGVSLLDSGVTDRVTFLVVDGEVVATYDPELAEPVGHAREVLDDAKEHTAA